MVKDSAHACDSEGSTWVCPICLQVGSLGRTQIDAVTARAVVGATDEHADLGWMTSDRTVVSSSVVAWLHYADPSPFGFCVTLWVVICYACSSILNRCRLSGA
mgnify:FL=1